DYCVYIHVLTSSSLVFPSPDTAPTNLYTLSLHDALPILPTEAWVDNDAFPELKTRVISTLVNPNILGGYLVLVISLITGLLSTRSEEHTSELQSRFDLVCRLLLEKKKNKYIIRYNCFSLY